MKTPSILLALAILVSARDLSKIDLITALQSQNDLSQLYDALLAVPDLTSDLINAVNITIFAPTNSAFEDLLALPDNSATEALKAQDTNAITSLLKYHVLPGTYLSSAITEVPVYLPTLLTPGTAGDAPTNVTDGQNVGVVANEGTVQVFSGEQQVSNVVEADIFLPLNQVTIHKIDKVLTIPNNLTTTLPQITEPYSLSAAVGAVAQAGLASTLDLVSNLTIFIPTNNAFNAIGSIIESADIETLTSVLTYHAIIGQVVFTSDLPNGKVTVSRGDVGDLTINGVDGTIFVNGAKVVLPNVILSNGVAHVIDAVLNPDAPLFDDSLLRPDSPAMPQFSGASFVDVAGALATAVPTATTSMSGAGGMATSTTTSIASASGSATGPAIYFGDGASLQTGGFVGLVAAVVAAVAVGGAAF